MVRNALRFCAVWCLDHHWCAIWMYLIQRSRNPAIAPDSCWAKQSQGIQESNNIHSCASTASVVQHFEQHQQINVAMYTLKHVAASEIHSLLLYAFVCFWYLLMLLSFSKPENWNLRFASARELPSRLPMLTICTNSLPIGQDSRTWFTSRSVHPSSK